MKITETCWAKSRKSSRPNGGNYESGFVMLSSLKAMIGAAEDAGMNAIGMSPKSVSTAKFNGTVIEITPFKLAPKA